MPVTRSSGPMVFDGEALKAIRARQFDEPQVLAAAGRLMREVIGHHLGGRELQSRKVLLELHRGRLSDSEKRKADSD